MAAYNEAAVLAVAERFAFGGEICSCTPYGEGHINGTFLITVRMADGKEALYILQRINTYVFSQPLEMMENIENVTAFLQERLSDPRRVLRLVELKDGGFLFRENEIDCWRAYYFVEDAICLQKPDTTEDFYQCAYAFGDFQRLLHDYPVEKLHETIPDFHNTPKRYRDFLAAVEADVCHRAADVAAEIAFVKERAAFYSVLEDACAAGVLPKRVTHNDTKINNVMLDEASRTALCVIDLDTIMPGFSVTDFGDAIRFGANTAAEDEKDLSKVSLDMDLFDIYAKGFLDGCGGMLTNGEIRLMPEGAKMMTMECGMRFLADYLQGDVYFKTAYPEHNLVRCRTQFRLVECMEEQWDAMKACTEKYAGNR